jgi:DNA-binding transcriptional LysR family regulator
VPFGVWKFVRGVSVDNVKVRGRMICNDGEVAVHWALDGHGIVLRSGWDIARYVRAGRLRIVLPEYSLPARDVYAVFHNSSHLSPRVRAFVDFIADRLNDLDLMESGDMGAI